MKRLAVVRKTIRRMAILAEYLQIKFDILVFGFCEDEAIISTLKVTIFEKAYRLAKRKGYKVFSMVDKYEINGVSVKHVYNKASKNYYHG